MVHLHGSSVSRLFTFENRNRFVTYAYQSANSLLESGNKVSINT